MMDFFVQIDNIVCETKKTNDVNYKVKFMNDMIAKGYKLYSYWEYYNSTLFHLDFFLFKIIHLVWFS